MASYPSSSSGLNWTIVGQGAIGLLAAANLQQQGLPVALHLRAAKTVQVQFIAADGKQQQHSFKPASTPYKAVLVPVKSYDAVAAIQQLLPLLSPNAQLVLSHNGMGVIEQVLPLLSANQGLWFLTTTHGALKTLANLTALSELTVQHTGQGQSILAPLNTAALHQQHLVSSTMEVALGPVQTVTDIQPFLWQKLMINAVINPLTALHNCKNGDLLKPKYAADVFQIVSEVCAVSQAAGSIILVEDALARVQQVMQATANNFSSMQQDIIHQRRTEINAISGFIVNQGRQYAINTPHNLQLQQQVLQLQQTYGL